MNKLKGITSIMVAALGLAGCMSSGGKREFACPMGQGVNCMGPTDVYAATENRDHLEGLTNDDGQISFASAPAQRGNHTEVVEADGALVLTGGPSAPVLDAPEDVPIRTPARVMRIWIAPWEDDSGDLNVPGKVFTEIEPRRWAVGETQPSGRAATLQLISAPQATVANEGQASGDATPAGTKPAGK